MFFCFRAFYKWRIQNPKVFQSYNIPISILEPRRGSISKRFQDDYE